MFQRIGLNNATIVNRIDNQPIHKTNETNTDFKSVLKDALNKVSKAEHEANAMQQMMMEGKVEDLHQVMIASQKASIMVEAAVQVQQKVIDAYNEVMRMQV